jgi:hypothetical protein
MKKIMQREKNYCALCKEKPFCNFKIAKVKITKKKTHKIQVKYF